MPVTKNLSTTWVKVYLVMGALGSAKVLLTVICNTDSVINLFDTSNFIYCDLYSHLFIFGKQFITSRTCKSQAEENVIICIARHTKVYPKCDNFPMVLLPATYHDLGL